MMKGIDTIEEVEFTLETIKMCREQTQCLHKQICVETTNTRGASEYNAVTARAMNQLSIMDIAMQNEQYAGDQLILLLTVHRAIGGVLAQHIEDIIRDHHASR